MNLLLHHLTLSLLLWLGLLSLLFSQLVIISVDYRAPPIPPTLALFQTSPTPQHSLASLLWLLSALLHVLKD